MNISFEVIGGKLKEVSSAFLVLSNIKRLKLLLLLNRLEPSSSAGIHRAAKQEGIYTNRETTYRALEDLVKTKLVSKTYDEEKKELVYSAKK
jgi:Fe2+ or Zn2+ uptake regulation protein